MTKSLGRTYSLLDFSGREMHYWPGNLPRRPHRVGVASPGTLYVRRYRALHPLVLVFREDANVPPPSSLLTFFSPFASPPGARRQSSRCAYIASFWKGRPGTSSHVRKVTARLLFPCRRRCRCQIAQVQKNLMSEICS